MTLHAQKVRVYFNDRRDAPKLWSIDFGDPLIEILVAAVFIKPNTYTQSKINLEAVPCAWFEILDCNITLHAGSATIDRE